jgi:hypothetical protein
MAELTEVIGSVLRDVARARATSDAFSREVSREYLDDEILRMFPVPRVEIGGVEVDVGFVVAEVSRRDVDRAHVARAVVDEHLNDLASRALTVRVKGTRNETMSLRIRLGDAVSDFVTSLEAQLGDAVQITSAEEADVLVENASAFASARIRPVLQALRTSVKESGQRIAIGSEPQRALADQLQEWSHQVATATRDVIDRQQKDPVVLDVSVTRAELQDVPEALLSHVRLMVEIENYEWTEFETESGREHRLVVR